MSASDGIKWHPRVHVAKYSPELVRELTEHLGYEPTSEDFARLSVDPTEVTERYGNLITTAGLGRITSLITGGGGQAFTNAQGIVGVGATNTAAARTDAALAGNGNSTTAWYQGIDASGLSLVTTSFTNDTIQAIATYASGNANFAWQEWCFGVCTGTITAGNTFASVGTSPLLINRAVQSLGTKVSGAVWVFTGKVTLS